MRKFIKILISIIIFIVIILVGLALYITYGLEAGKKVEVNGINISDIKDGVYNGKYNAGRWSNEVNVTVSNKRIIDIKIIDDVTFPMKSVSDEIFNRVIETQNTKVDAVSGATVTSKAYLKSIENAFK